MSVKSVILLSFSTTTMMAVCLQSRGLSGYSLGQKMSPMYIFAYIF